MRTNHLLHALNMPSTPSNRSLWAMVGAWLLIALPIASRSAWGTWLFWDFPNGWPMIVLSATAFMLAAAVLSRLQSLPRSGGWGGALFCLTVAFFIVVVIVALSRLYYSRTFLGVIYPLSFLILLAGVNKNDSKVGRHLALVPGGQSRLLTGLPGFKWLPLQAPLLGEPVDGVVVDMHQRLPFEWGLFLSDCALKRIPVYHAALIYESETGRASMAHFSEGLLNVVHGAELFAVLKRGIDLMLILFFLPLWFPLFLAVAAAVKLTSPGSVFFWQERVGQAEKPFRMVKFRSMRTSAEKNGSAFAEHGDGRVTNVGRFLRKVRLDELPQFWNVLKGEMSLIGPRPEQLDFVRQFKEEIPYYTYRHVVKPGITGWAQINQGYAADTVSTQQKVEYDLYYIKHLSFWLDFLILIKTFRIIVTGFGAR